MKKFLAALLIGLSLVTFTLDASAARLGGGASFGRSMSVPKASPSFPKAAPSTANRPSAAPAAGAAAAAKSGGLGRSLLIGAATALGFMALANMLGLGEGFAQILMFLALAALALFAFRFFAAKKAASSAGNSSQNPTNIFQRPSQPEPYSAPEPMQKEASNPFSGMASRPGSAMDEFSDSPSTGAQNSDSSFEVPAEFDKEAFLQMSTSYFKMLQGAWDSGDMDNLSNYCTDDMFIELTHRRREIKGANVTMILSLTPSLAGFETTPTEYVASVLFEGKLNENGEPTDVKEIWNLVKPREGKSGWLLAGIEQAE